MSFCKDKVAVVTGAGGTLCGPIAADLAKQGAKVVLIEDLISTGGSVLAAATAVTAAGGEVLGVLAVFSYELPAATLAFANAGIDLITLSNYPTLLSVASERGDLTQEQQEALANWSASPQEWSDRFEAGD